MQSNALQLAVQTRGERMNPSCSASAVNSHATLAVDASHAVSVLDNPRGVGQSSDMIPENMVAKIPKALLVDENPQGLSHFAKRLKERGFQCDFASTSEQTVSLIRMHRFDLILSPIRLRDASLCFLMDLLDGALVTLFYFYAVEDGCWWLPAIRQGNRCWGTSALRPSEFAFALNAAIEEVRLSF